MTPQFHPFTDLVIIGCREVPAKPFLPRILTPIFRHRDGSVFLPPYETVDGSYICNPVTISEEEFNDLCRQERVSRISRRDPMPNNQLYLDDEGFFCYEHRSRVADAMLSYHRDHRAKAEAALRSGDCVKAIHHARIARSANPNDIDLLLLKAAALIRLGQTDEAAVCRTFVGSRLTEAMYESGVAEWRGQIKESAPNKLVKLGIKPTKTPWARHLETISA